MSDRDKADLRGAVKTMVDEQMFSRDDGQPWLSTTVSEYAPNGRTLQRRLECADGSQWLDTYTYDSVGRLLKISSGKVDSSLISETTYLYDTAGMLVGIRWGDNTEIRYQYDDKGCKSVIQG